MDTVEDPPHAEDLRRTDFGLIGRASERGAMAFAEALPFEAGERVLDIGCGTGSCAIALARSACDVTGVDGREPHLSRARAWASNEKLKVRFKQAQYERLPFSDNNFHLTLSFMGLLFSRDPDRALGEAQRVTHPEGTLAVTAWSLDGFMGKLLSVTADRTGDDGFVRALSWCERDIFHLRVDKIAEIHSTTRHAMTLRFPWSPDEVAQCYLRYYTPLARVFTNLKGHESARLLQDALRTLCRDANEAGDNATEISAPYREIVAAVKPS